MTPDTLPDFGTIAGVAVATIVVVAMLKRVFPKLAAEKTVLVALAAGIVISVGHTTLGLGHCSAAQVWAAAWQGVFGAASAVGIAWAVREPPKRD